MSRTAEGGRQVAIDDEGRALVAAAWRDRRMAGRTVGELVAGTGRVQVHPLDAAAIVLGHDDRLRIEGDRPGAVTISGVLGALLGVLTGGPGWLILGGGVVEHLAAAAAAAGLPRGPLQEFGAALHPGDSAVVAVAPAASVSMLQHELGLLAGSVLVQHLDPAVVHRTGTTAAVRYDAGQVDGDVLAARTFTSHG